MSLPSFQDREIQKQRKSLEFKIKLSSQLINSYEFLCKEISADSDSDNEKSNPELPKLQTQSEKYIFTVPKKVTADPLTSSASILPPISITRIKKLPNEDSSLYISRANQSTTQQIKSLIEKCFGTTDLQAIQSIYNEQQSIHHSLTKESESAKYELKNLLERKQIVQNEIKETDLSHHNNLRLLTHSQHLLQELLTTKESIQNEIYEIHRLNKTINERLNNIFEMLQINTNNLTQEEKTNIAIEYIENTANSPIKLKQQMSKKVSFLFSSRNSFFNISDANSLTSDITSVPGVPLLSMHSISHGSDFVPCSRSSRRVFSSFSSMSTFSLNSNRSTEEDMPIVGKLLGNLFIERYSNHFIKYNKEVKIFDKKITPKEMEINGVKDDTKEIMYTIVDNYQKNQNNLHLLQLEYFEIKKTNSSEEFLEFISKRNHLFQLLLSDNFNYNIFHHMILSLFNENETSACWILRDFLLLQSQNYKTEIPIFFGEVQNFFMNRIGTITSSIELKNTIPFIAWCGLFETFLDLVNDSEQLHNSISQIFPANFSTVINVLNSNFTSQISRFGFVSILKIGFYFPSLFKDWFLFNNISSIIIRYVRQNICFPTCVKSGINFFTVSYHFLEEDMMMFYTSFIFHNLIITISRLEIPINILESLLSSIISIVANRHNYTTTQLLNLNFLQFLSFNIELEYLITKTAPKNKSQTANDSSTKPYIPLLDLNIQNNETKENELDYEKEKSKYPIYITKTIHIKFIQLLFATLISHSFHRLDHFFCDEFPYANRKLNILYTLMKHMENENNQYIVNDLLNDFTMNKNNKQNVINNSINQIEVISNNEEEDEFPELFTSVSLDHKQLERYLSIPNFIPNIKMEEFNIKNNNKLNDSNLFQDYSRLLKLTVPKLFDPNKYSNGTFIGSGAFGAVMNVTLNGDSLAVKVLDKSKNEFDNPHLIEVYTEVSVLEICKGDRRVTQLYDYGCTDTSYYVVMEYYPLTLKSWRKSLDSNNLPINTILRVYREFLYTATVLIDYQINHFDLKCDNIMLDNNGTPAIADFGESVQYNNEENSFITLNRGTEWIKPPEMLSIALNSSAANPNFDRTRKIGVGPEGDVWSIGCLFYELLTDEFLFIDTDWCRFYLRISDEKEELLTKQNLEALPNDQRFASFLRFVLQRDYRRRPNLNQVIAKFDEMFPDVQKEDLPKINS